MILSMLYTGLYLVLNPGLNYSSCSITKLPLQAWLGVNENHSSIYFWIYVS